MYAKSNPVETDPVAELEQHWQAGSYAHANNLTLERLPNGEHAWLRPSSDAGEADDALFVVTDLGRRAVAAAALFDPSLTVADVVASRPACCPACGRGQDTPSCARREHWGVS